jgi:hypothetical protein
VGSGHSPTSLHEQTFPGTKVGRAFDAYRSSIPQARYARHLRRHYVPLLTEAIYNGRWTKLSIKDGKHVDPSYWGADVWAAHRDHVHVAI